MSLRGVVFRTISKSIDDGIDGLTLENRPSQQVGKGQVKVKVYASAANFFDLLMLVGQYQFKPKLPSGIGSEASGIITEVGSGVSHLKVGQRVIITMSIACMADEVVVPAMNILPLPPHWSFAEGACFSVGYFTAYHGLVQRGQLTDSDTVLITGAAGGMGIAAIQLAKHIGAKVFGLVSSRSKAEQALAAGADKVYISSSPTNDFTAETDKRISYSLLDILKDTDNKGVSVIYDVVGGTKLFSSLLKVSGRGCRILIVGFAGGDIQKIPANLLLVKSVSVLGVAAGAEMQRDPAVALEMLDYFIKNVVKKPITEVSSSSPSSPSPNRNTALIPPAITAVSCADLTKNPHEHIESVKSLYREMHNRKLQGKAVVLWRDGANDIPPHKPRAAL